MPHRSRGSQEGSPQLRAISHRVAAAQLQQLALHPLGVDKALQSEGRGGDEQDQVKSESRWLARGSPITWPGKRGSTP